VTSSPRPVLYFDLGSPYAYLSVERAPRVLGEEHALQPVLLGAIFAHRGRGSWAHTAERDANVAEVERRARAYGLALTWPEGWPPNSLTAMRAATFAQQRGLTRELALAAYRAAFVAGEDLGELDVVLRAGKAAGLDPEELAAAVAAPSVKAALRSATEEAIAAGVRGVPSVRVGGDVLYGDDRLELAARGGLRA
jgi:2-hydroxychromene-2-carboxylate isomerase